MKQSDQVHSELIRRIVQMELRPGTPLRETEVAQMLGHSRTPVREALQRLIREGLAVNVGRTVVVADITTRDIAELFQLREALETYAVTLCARVRPRVFLELAESLKKTQASLAELNDSEGSASSAGPAPADEYREYYEELNRFDEALLSYCNNSQLADALDQVWTRSHRLRLLARRLPERLVRSAGEHQVIAQAIAEGRETDAAEATVIHLRNSYGHVIAELIASTAGDASSVIGASGAVRTSATIAGHLAAIDATGVSAGSA